MKKVKLTIKEAQQKRLLIANNINPSVFDKLSYAAEKVISNIDSACKVSIDLLNEKIGDLRVKYALTDKVTGAIIINRDQSGEHYQYTPEAIMQLRKDINKETALFEETLIEFDPYLSADCPGIKKIRPQVIESLEGILFEKGTFDKCFVSEVKSTNTLLN